MSHEQEIPIANICLSKSPIPRAELNLEVVSEYAARMLAGDKYPPITLYQVGNDLLLTDGLHRLQAVKRNGGESILAIIYPNADYDAALCAALQANTKHGLRRSRADKQVAVELALKRWPNYSNAYIARLVQVDDHTVASVRALLERTGELKSFKRRIAKDGRLLPPVQPTRHPTACDHDKNPTIQSPCMLLAAKTEVQSSPTQVGSPIDGLGNPIPDPALVIWNRRHEIQAVIDRLIEIENLLKAAKDDPLWHEFMFQAALTDLNNLITTVRSCMPWVVCPFCNALALTKCDFCASTGLISKFRWDHAVPSEMKRKKYA